MADTLTTTFSAKLNAVLKSSTDEFKVARNIEKALTDGTGLNQANKVFRWYGNIGTGGTEFNLTDGSLKSPSNEALVFTKLKTLIVFHDGLEADVANILQWGGGTNPVAWIGSTVRDIGGPASSIVRFVPTLAGMPVSAGAADRIKLIAAAGTIPTYLAITGTM